MSSIQISETQQPRHPLQRPFELPQLEERDYSPQTQLIQNNNNPLMQMIAAATGSTTTNKLSKGKITVSNLIENCSNAKIAEEGIYNKTRKK
jgi:hypothetical protein